jgi:hypothetical protein
MLPMFRWLLFEGRLSGAVPPMTKFYQHIPTLDAKGNAKVNCQHGAKSRWAGRASRPFAAERKTFH